MDPTLPTVEPISGAPIVIDPSLTTGGKYIPPSIVDKVLSYLPLLNHSAAGTIKVNPKNANDVNTDIRHEAIHAVLNGINQSGELDAMNKANPAFASLASSFPAWAGEVNQEMPAYAGTGEYEGLKMVKDKVSPYTAKLIEQLMKLDPKLAQKYQALSRR